VAVLGKVVSEISDGISLKSDFKGVGILWTVWNAVVFSGYVIL
jgi:hypothetical protein